MYVFDSMAGLFVCLAEAILRFSLKHFRIDEKDVEGCRNVMTQVMQNPRLLQHPELAFIRVGVHPRHLPYI